MVRFILAVVLCVFLIGCGEKAVSKSDSGAEATARDYFESMIRSNWAEAYSALHPESKRTLSLGQFSNYAQMYRQKLGFEPQTLVIQSCTEREKDAVVHLVIKGTRQDRERIFKEGAVLKRTTDGWGIVLLDQHKK
jgi:hypothetical protein